MPLNTIDVVNATGSVVSINTPRSGRAAAADSQAVVMSNEDLAAIGATNSTAAIDETTNTGLNGVLKGILAAIRARLPILNNGRTPVVVDTAIATGTNTIGAVNVNGILAVNLNSSTTYASAANQVISNNTLSSINNKFADLEAGRTPVAVQNIATSTRFYNFAAGQRLTTNSSAAIRSTAITATEVLLHASVRGFFCVGTSTVTATVGAGSIPIAQDEKFHLRINTGEFVSFIRDGGTDGSLTIMPVL